jgi:hypothetical protein
MSYQGETYSIPMNRGGLTANPNIDLIEPEMMVMARNINTFDNGRGKRGGTAHFSTASTRDSQLMGVIDFTLADGSQFIVTTTTEGEVWKDNTTQLNSGNLLKVGAFTTFSVVNEKLYICDGGTTPQTWDGIAASTSDLAAVPSDWTGSNFPTQIIVHGAGGSERGWALGCQSTPHTLYITPETAGGDLDFTQGTIQTFNRETGDGYGLVGGVEFGDKLIVFGKNQAYVVDDSELDISNWRIQAAQWKGGVAHSRLIVKTPNDVVCMMDDGTIYSVAAVQEFGDYKIASITKPSWIDKWIRENTDLGKINQFHGVYDPELRIIRFFVVRSGQTNIDTCLVYNIDKGPEEGWVIHDNQTNASGFDASCSAVVLRVPAEDHSTYIYTGDYLGNVWELEEGPRNDNGEAYFAGFKTARLNFANARVTKKYRRGWLITEEKGDYNLFINTWVDGVSLAQQTVDLSGAGALWGTMVWGSFTWAGDALIDQPFDIGTKGKRIQFEIFNSNVNEDFFVSQMLIDHKVLSNRPQ